MSQFLFGCRMAVASEELGGVQEEEGVDALVCESVPV